MRAPPLALLENQKKIGNTINLPEASLGKPCGLQGFPLLFLCLRTLTNQRFISIAPRPGTMVLGIDNMNIIELL